MVLTKTYKDSEAYRFFVNCIPSRGFGKGERVDEREGFFFWGEGGEKVEREGG